MTALANEDVDDERYAIAYMQYRMINEGKTRTYVKLYAEDGDTAELFRGPQLESHSLVLCWDWVREICADLGESKFENIAKGIVQ